LCDQRLSADAEHFRVQRFESLHVIYEAHVLFGASGAPIQRVEHQHHVFLSREVRNLDFLVVLILQTKIRGCLSDGDGHLASPFERKCREHPELIYFRSEIIVDSTGIDKAEWNRERLRLGCRIWLSFGKERWCP
jgi:hypothetical protein